MINKNVKKALLSFAAVVSIFSTTKVNAARTITGLGDDTNSSNIKVVNNVSQSVTTSNSKLEGSVCQTYQICMTNNISQSQGEYSENAHTWIGPYLEHSANLMYEATAQCASASGTSTAFCLEANFTGPSATNGCLTYKANQIDTNSLYQVSLFELYKISKGYNLSDPQTYFAFEAAARLLAYEDSSYHPRDNTSKTTMNAYSAVYRGGIAGASAIGPVGAQAGSLASQALSAARSEMNNLTDGTLGLRVNQIGGYNQNGGSYQSAFAITVQNVSSANQVGWGDLSFSLPAVQQGDAVYDANAKTLTFTALVSGIAGASDSCVTSSLEVTLNYSSSNDIRNAFILDALSTTAIANRQRFAVFNDGPGGVVKYTYTINNCPDKTVDACQPIAGFYCEQSDVNGPIVINEGSHSLGGETDWENCIIGKTDSQGNSYDVVNNSEYVQTELTGEYSDSIQGFTSDGKEITDAAYCTVSCKEKYTFVLPGYKEQVKQGTYFSFHSDGNSSTHVVVGINAERECASSNVKTENFNSRALDLRAQQVDYLNAYLYYYQIYQALLTNDAARQYNEDSLKEISVLKGIDSPDKCDSVNPSSEQTLIDAVGWEEKKYLLGWDESKLGNISVTLYHLANPKALDGGELVKQTYSVNLKQAYKDVVKTPEVSLTNAVASQGYNFYSSVYGSDYDIFSYVIPSVAGWNDTPIVEEPYSYFDDDTHTVNHPGEWRNLGPGVPPDWQEPWSEDVCNNTPTEDLRNISVNAVVYGANSDEWDESKIQIMQEEQFTNYREVLNDIASKMEKAKEKYEALIKQIGVQATSIQECTNYLQNFTSSSNPYYFDPVVTFSYPDQSTYMAMLSPNRLTNVKATSPTVEYTTYFCESDPGSAAAIFTSCSNGGAGEGISMNYLYNFDLSTPEQISSKSAVSSTLNSKIDPNNNMDVIEYFNVARVGSKATYGRTEYNGVKYEFYQSDKQFYTIAPDGLVTTNPSGKNATILDTDGRVYPVAINTPEGQYPFYVTFANIGQFNESGALGRIMGGGDGKAGTMSGEAYDTEVCYYEVCRVDDPTCGKEASNDTCTTDVTNYCNAGNISDPFRFSDDNYKACLEKLMADGCCDEVSAYKNIRQGKFNKMIPDTIWSEYNATCNNANSCTSFTIVSTESYVNTSSNLSDIAVVNNNGALQLNARAVSNNNLFPNGNTSVNWNTSDAQRAITDIESIGDGIFAQDSEYHVSINASCAAAIRQYNTKEEGEGSGYSNGGFNDYTNTVTDATTVENNNIGSKGRTVVMSEEFRKILEDSCGYTGKSSPDTIVDSSRVES